MNLTFSAPYSRLAQDSPRRGFALLVTIVLVAFLVLILVGLATFTRVETTVAANSQKQAQARQNALMALNIAIGQLQKTTGPDQRITARADIVTPSTVSSLTPTATAQTQIDTYWAAQRNRNWTGVWQNTTPLVATATYPAVPYDVANPAAANATPSAPTWLISGSEISTAYNPTTPVTNLSLSSSATSTLTDDNGFAHRLLVGNNTVGNSQLANYVTAPVIPITVSNIPGFTSNATIGNYAWWVGDEGIKARANLTDTYAPPVSPATALTADERLWRLQSAQRPAIEAATGLSAYPANDANLPRVLQNEQLPFIRGCPSRR